MSDFRALFNYSWVNYFIYRFKYPKIALPISSIIKGDVVLESNINIGKNTQVIGNINIGRNSSINENCKVYGDVEIGDNCLLSNNIFISSGGHTYDKEPFLPIKEQDILHTINKKILIEDDCWIGINVVIMPGVIIGKGSIIGANSVITKSVYPYSVVGGIPAKVIKKRLIFLLQEEISFKEISDIPYFYKGFLIREYEKKRFSVYDGLLTKLVFTLKLDVLNKDILFMEAKKYSKRSRLFYNSIEYTVDTKEFTLLEIDISSDKSLSFSVSEPIIIKRCFV